MKHSEEIKIGTVAASVHAPAEKPDTLVILLPGYLDSKDYAHLVMLAESLQSSGYTAVRADLSGTWGSGDDLSRYTVSQHLADIQAVVDFMLQQNSYQNIFIGGHSRGGFLAILSAIQDTRISGAFAIMSPYALMQKPNEEKVKRWQEKGFRAVFMDIPGTNEKKELRMPYIEANIADAQKHNILEEVRVLNKPLLFIAGEEDTLITPAHVKELYEAANEPKTFVVMKGIGHDYRHREEEIEQVNREVLAWLDETVTNKKL